MFKNISYLNSSIWDTLSGEYYRSFVKKNDYFHIFDYIKWDENLVNDTLIHNYNWEKDPETPTTWRIGDGTAAFYNYIYFLIAGFTENDTFRSNQIREGLLTRAEGLERVNEENKIRWSSLQWYCKTIGINWVDTINIINKIKPIYQNV